jgi:hypothetical protein
MATAREFSDYLTRILYRKNFILHEVFTFSQFQFLGEYKCLFHSCLPHCLCMVQIWASIKLTCLRAFQCMLICFLFLQQLGHFYAYALNFEQWTSHADLVIGWRVVYLLSHVFSMRPFFLSVSLSSTTLSVPFLRSCCLSSSLLLSRISFRTNKDIL